MSESLLDKFSKCPNDTIITDAWISGQIGKIVDIDGDYVYRFIEYENDGDLRIKHIKEDDKLSYPIVATGFVGYWLHFNGNLGLRNLFESYYEFRLREYEKVHEADEDVWNRDLQKEFVCSYHIPLEKKLIKASEAIFAYVTTNDKNKINNVSTNYLKFVRAKRKELYPPKHPQNRIIEDTFLDAYRVGGPAYECMNWMRTEYNLPYIRPHLNISDKTEKEKLTGKWKKNHEEFIPEYVREEYEDFNDGVLTYTNGGLMDEINENLKNYLTTDDRIRYIISLLQPFKEFADAFCAKERIDERKESILKSQKLIEDYKIIKEKAKDECTQIDIEPQKQIATCIEYIENCKKDIDYWEKVQKEFYYFAQHGLTGKFEPRENQEMCEYLGGWWSLMIRFFRRLAALILTYGIKLVDIQKLCKVYLVESIIITDYVDYKYITSIGHAKTLLNKIELSHGKSPKELIFTNHEEFDAWCYVSNLIRSAKERIVIVDGYIDERVLNLLTKRHTGVTAIVYSRYNASFRDDVEKFNKQYEPIVYRQFQDKVHDRFLIIDERVYHLGASIKDIGNSLSAITIMDITPQMVIDQLAK